MCTCSSNILGYIYRTLPCTDSRDGYLCCIHIHEELELDYMHGRLLSRDAHYIL